MGQTSWGTLIRSNNELNERMRQSVRDSEANVRRFKERAAQEHGPAYVPYRPLSAKEKAEHARRERIRAAITRKASFWQRLSGKVISYLDEEGELLVVGSEFAAGPVIPRADHLARLRKAYERLWQKRLDKHLPDRDTDETAAKWCEEASEKLALLKRGYFMCPIDSKGQQSRVALYRTKKTLFGSKVVRNKIWKVSAKEYDRRLRLFMGKVFSGQSRFSTFTFNEEDLIDAAPDTAFLFFLSAPSFKGKDG
jgi:hypothetical protein